MIDKVQPESKLVRLWKKPLNAEPLIDKVQPENELVRLYKKPQNAELVTKSVQLKVSLEDCRRNHSMQSL